jgi:hypothetical protein
MGRLLRRQKCDYHYEEQMTIHRRTSTAAETRRHDVFVDTIPGGSTVVGSVAGVSAQMIHKHQRHHIEFISLFNIIKRLIK